MSLKIFCGKLIRRAATNTDQVVFNEMNLMNTFSFLGGNINLVTFSQEVMVYFSLFSPDWIFSKRGNLIYGQKKQFIKPIQKELFLNL